jgi:uncharacterized membrane protein (UPF0127 family)
MPLTPQNYLPAPLSGSVRELLRSFEFGLQIETADIFFHPELMKHLLLLALWLIPALCGGCTKAADSVPASVVVDPSEPTQAQPRLQTMKIYVQAQEMVAELALTPDQQRTGMMFRTNMGENEGMLFPLPFTQRASFWMKHCPLPLSAAYIDQDGIIQEIHDFQANNTNAVVAASDAIRFVLETPQGWFKKHNITAGVAITTERGPLMRTFFSSR